MHYVIQRIRLSSDSSSTGDSSYMDNILDELSKIYLSTCVIGSFFTNDPLFLVVTLLCNPFSLEMVKGL